MFLLVGITIMIIGALYIAIRINMGFHISGFQKYILPIAAVFGIFFIAFIQFNARKGLASFLHPLVPFAYILMGCFAITITVFVIIDIISLINIFLKIKSFNFYSTTISLILSAVLCISALINFAFFLSIKEIRIKVPNLPIESLKIVHLADLHITPYVSTKKIINIFSKIMDLKPDIIVFTGDIMDFDINKNDKFMEYGFANLKSPYGIYAVSGNHDYYTGIKSFQEMFSKLGIKVLNDENIMVKNTDRTNIINIAGINDINYHNTQKISQSLSNLNLKYPTIFLSHRPESFDIASSYADIIAFAGHTHAGQIPPVWIVRKFFMKYNYGIYNLGKSIMYITSGTRLWGPPMRLFSTSEIAVIILERE